MFAKFCILAVCLLGASAQENFVNIENGLNALQSMTDAAGRNLQATLAVLDVARADNEKMARDRLDCIVWERKGQVECLNKSIAEAVFKGMLKNKQFVNFQCISNARRQAMEKIDTAFSKVPQNFERISEKHLTGVLPFRFLVAPLRGYLKDFHQKRHEELLKTKTDKERNRILEEARKKMSLLGKILDQIKTKVKDSRFEFFAEFVDFIHAVENSMRKSQREGGQKALKCVA